MGSDAEFQGGSWMMKWLTLVLLMPVFLGISALLVNRAPLLDPPGPMSRLKLYLTSNVAETRLDHERPELRPLRLRMPVAEARALVLRTLHRLNWLEIFDDQEVIQAVVETPLLRFHDDIEIRLEAVDADVLVQVRSASRMGRGDLAANTRHILDLYHALSH